MRLSKMAAAFVWWVVLCHFAAAAPLPHRISNKRSAGFKALVSSLDDNDLSGSLKGASALLKSALRHAPG